jgi:LuxR family maltose regulon positive regulatory protein
MESDLSLLIVTKYRIPALRSRYVPRDALIRTLSSTADASLILVSAPAGYGKTSLLVEWSQTLLKESDAVAWYALDETDDDPLFFGEYITASLGAALGKKTNLEQLIRQLGSSTEIELRKVIPAWINAVTNFPGKVVLVLDDYHLITNPHIHSAIGYLLEYMPENLRLAIGSRVDPPFSLARLRARGKLLEFHAADLSFSTDEAFRFLNDSMRFDLPADMVNVLETRTEGWVAGLQLATLSLAGRSDRAAFIQSFGGSHRHMAEYLLTEVIDHQPEDIRTFLLMTSILERLNGALCDEITGREDGSAEILARLLRENHFIVALDDSGEWFRYHHLYREFLQKRLHETRPEWISSLHRRAATWFAARGYLREAVNHALLSNNWEFAADLVEQHGIPLMLRGEYATIHAWCAAFPEEIMQSHPTLCLLQGNALLFAYRRAYREPVEKRMSQVEQAAAQMNDSAIARLFNGQAAVTRAFLAAVTPDPAADPQQFFPLAQKAFDLISLDDPGRSAVTLASAYAWMALNETDQASSTLEEVRQLSGHTDNLYMIVEAAFHQARIAQIQGRLSEVTGICHQAAGEIDGYLAHPGEDLPAVGCLDIAEGCACLEMCDLESAEEKVSHGLTLIGRGMNPYYQMTGCLALFRLYTLRNNPRDALFSLERLADAWPDISFLTEGLRLLWNLKHTPRHAQIQSQVKNWCRQYESLTTGRDDVPVGYGPYAGTEVFYQARLVWIQLQIALGDLQHIRLELENLLWQADSGGLIQHVIELSLLEADILRQKEDSTGTLQAVGRALAAAEAHGFLTCFIEHKDLADFLSHAAVNGRYRGFIQRICEAGRVEQSALPQDLIEPLSQRELEVLKLIAQGASNRQIAAGLVISVGTVKSHINHILGKIGAENRTEAAARGRQLGLIRD